MLFLTIIELPSSLSEGGLIWGVFLTSNKEEEVLSISEWGVDISFGIVNSGKLTTILNTLIPATFEDDFLHK